MRAATAEDKVREISYSIAKRGKCSYLALDKLERDFLDAYLRKCGWYLKHPGMPYAVGDESLDPENGSWYPVSVHPLESEVGGTIQDVDFPTRSRLASFRHEDELPDDEREHLRACRFFFKGCKFGS